MSFDINPKLPAPNDKTLAAWRRADRARADADAAKASKEAAIIATAFRKNPFGRADRDLTAQAVILRLRPDLAERLRAEAARAGA